MSQDLDLGKSMQSPADRCYLSGPGVPVKVLLAELAAYSVP